MKTLLVAFVLTLLGFSQVNAETYYCIELRICGTNSVTSYHPYLWLDNQLLQVGDIIRIDYWSITGTGFECGGPELHYQHKAMRLPSSCDSTPGTHKGWVWFDGNEDGDRFEVVSIGPY